MSWNEGYILTLYCTACNNPKGSRDIAYTEGIYKKATAGLTVAVHPDFYDLHKGERIHLEILDKNGNIIASHQPYILDFHGVEDYIIDLYIGEKNKCICSEYNGWSGKRCRFKFINE